MSEREIVEALLTAGYHEWRVPPISSADRFFQRRVTGEGGLTLYFLNVGLYDRNGHGRFGGERYALQLDVDLYHPQWGESSIELTFGVPAAAEGIAGAEAMVAKLYAAGGFEPDLPCLTVDHYEPGGGVVVAFPSEGKLVPETIMEEAGDG